MFYRRIIDQGKVGVFDRDLLGFWLGWGFYVCKNMRLDLIMGIKVGW